MYPFLSLIYMVYCGVILVKKIKLAKTVHKST